MLKKVSQVGDNMFTKEQKEKLKAMGSVGLTTKLAQHDGYHVDENESQEKQLMGIFGQKYMTKKASLKTISKGIQSMQKLGCDLSAGNPGFYEKRVNSHRINKSLLTEEVLNKLLSKE